MSEWIEWKGGECPVHPDTIVEVKIREGRTAIDYARRFKWVNARMFYIVAYRVVKEKEE